MLTSQRLPLKAATIISLLFLGLVGLMLLFVSTEIYREMVLKNERKNLQTITGIESSEILKSHKSKINELIGHMALEKGFKQSVEQTNIDRIQFFLNQQFFQYYVTANIIDLKHLVVLNRKFEQITASQQHSFKLNPFSACPKFFETMARRQGIDRIKPTFHLCNIGDTPVLLGVFAIGTFNPIGYIVAFSQITKDFENVERDLGMPISLSSPTQKILFQSENWDQLESNTDTLITKYVQKNSSGDTILNIEVARDFSELSEDLVTLRSYAMLSGTLITFIAIMLSLFFLSRSALNPLNQLNHHMRILRNDKSKLGDTVDIVANPEIMELADNFNQFSKELQKAYKTMERMAYTDPLTDLPNRSQLQRQLDYHTAQVVERNLPFSFFLMDLDRFKTINDTLGHQAGDELLQQVSERLQKVLRKTDIVTVLNQEELAGTPNTDVARLGGDEFAMLLPSVGNVDDATNIANKIIQEMDRPFIYEETEYNVGISIGIAMAPVHGNDGMTLMRKADIAMYHAKNNQLGFSFYDQADDTHSLEILSLDRDIRNAINNDEFQLYYQPKIDLDTNNVIGVEGLIRWVRKNGSIVMPDQFIPFSEQNGMIQEITRWVVSEATSQLHSWQNQNIALSISINLSPKCLYNRELLTHVLDNIAEKKLEAKRLFIEITESCVMSDPTRSVIILDQFHACGIRLSIDDFGTGFSSLSKLKSLPVDEIKIDRSFVSDMLSNKNDATIVRSIIDLAQNMGLKSIAEGVENEETLAQLIALGCNEAQGYYIGMPMPLEEFEQWLKKSKWKI